MNPSTARGAIDRFRKSRLARAAGTVLGAVLLISGIIGLISLPADIASWIPVIGWIVARLIDATAWLAGLGGEAWRTTMTVAGLALLFFFNLRTHDRVGTERAETAAQEQEPRPSRVAPAAAPPVQSPPVGRIAHDLNAFRQRAERLRREYESQPAGEGAAAFHVLVTELDRYLRDNNLEQYLPAIEGSLEIGFVPGSAYDWMAADENGVYEVDSALGHEVRLGRLRDELVRILGGLPPPTDHPISMADGVRRTAVREEVTAELWQRMTEGPDVPPAARRVRREPTDAAIAERAEWLLAQYSDAVGTDHSPHFGPRQARLMARDQLRREAVGSGDET